MISDSLILFTLVTLLFALIGHEQPARNPEKKSPAGNLGKPQEGRKT
jgi:hypothetical protein